MSGRAGETVRMLKQLRQHQHPERPGELVERTRADSRSNDPLVVATCELRAVICPWVAKVDATRQVGGNADPRLSGIMQIALDAGLDPTAVQKLVSGDVPEFVSLAKADAMLTAIGDAWALSDGRVRVRPSPRWRPERWRQRMVACGVDRPEDVLS